MGGSWLVVEVAEGANFDCFNEVIEQGMIVCYQLAVSICGSPAGLMECLTALSDAVIPLSTGFV